MKDEKKRTVVIAVKSGYWYIALWQWIALIVLVLFLWMNEILDLPSVYFGSQPCPFDFSRACISSAAVILTGIIVVGHTYLQQQQVIRGLVSICSYCKKIRVDSEVWQQIEQYVGGTSQVAFTHGVCPECYKKAMQEIGDSEPASLPVNEHVHRAT